MLLQGLLIVALWLAYRRRIALWLIAVLSLVPQAMSVIAFVSGAELQMGYAWWSRLQVAAAAPPYEPFTVRGDPGLRLMVAAQPQLFRRPVIGSAAHMTEWQGDLRSRLRQDVFSLPPLGERSTAEQFTVLSTVDLPEGVRRQFVTYSGFDGTAIPGYLFHRPGQAKRPAILVISGHGFGVVETAGLMRSYQNSVALKLAEEGYVTFTPELRGFGYLGSRIGNEHRSTAQNALAAGTFYKAVVLRDLTIALDRMEELPQVDGRLAATGVSYGGELALALTALDPRLRMAVVQGHGGEGVGPDLGGSGDYFTTCNHFCHTVPKANTFINQEDIAVMVAPRPLMIVRGLDEEMLGSPMWSLLETVYKTYGEPASFRFVAHPGYHEYWLDPAIPFFLRYHPLRGDASTNQVIQRGGG
jgi:hypothetical protein